MASDLAWTEVKVGELPEEIQREYAASKGAYREYKGKKQTFEQAMQAHVADRLAPGMELKFGYNFGKLSVAVGPKVERKEAKPKQGLEQWLAGQVQSGARA